MNKIPAPQFTFPLSELIPRTQNMLRCFQRDKNYFREYGVKEVTFKKISDSCKNLNDVISITELDKKPQKEKKKISTIQSQLYTTLKGFENSVRLIYGAKSMEFRLFKFRCLHNNSNCNLAEYAQYVVKIAKPRLTELKKRHITEVELDHIMDKSVELTDSINTYSQLICEQEEIKAEYIESANQLFSITNELCDIGKKIWYNTDETLYQEYDLYSSTKSLTTYN